MPPLSPIVTRALELRQRGMYYDEICRALLPDFDQMDQQQQELRRTRLQDNVRNLAKTRGLKLEPLSHRRPIPLKRDPIVTEALELRQQGKHWDEIAEAVIPRYHEMDSDQQQRRRHTLAVSAAGRARADGIQLPPLSTASNRKCASTDKARMKKLSPKQRSKIARHAAQVRWSKRKRKGPKKA